MTAGLNEEAWMTLLTELSEGRVPRDAVHSAIVRLGKPYNLGRIERAKGVIAKYLNDGDPWVRHEAAWFLSCWGRLPEFEPHIIDMMLNDSSEDNRGFAANCLGQLKAESQDTDVLDVLRRVVLDEKQTASVRVTAYGSMRKVAAVPASPSDEYRFRIGDKDLSEIDWNWVQNVGGIRR